MKQKFGALPVEEAMPDKGVPHLVEETGMRTEEPGSWWEWMAAQQRQQFADQQQLF